MPKGYSSYSLVDNHRLFPLVIKNPEYIQKNFNSYQRQCFKGALTFGSGRLFSFFYGKRLS